MQALPNRFDPKHRDYQWLMAAFTLLDKPRTRASPGVLVPTSVHDNRAID